ncbi:hypothetical protein CRG98_017045 [Punica granatum]|uniref:Uncharacterized protein n=1 Tax=Punica granatum TaxID=22663 RepID=A0A2I0K3D0_PUNGR|nr:hypothetical protein CRG98_017045 [Punica granatum]
MTRIKIKELPSSIGMLKRLEVLDAELCRSLVEIPSTIEGLTCLRVLKLRDTSVCRLPPKLPTKLDSLSYISFWYCKVRNLAGFCLPESLCELDIACCFFLKTVSALSHLKNLKKLEVSSVTELVEIRDLGELECLQTLNISYCDRLKRLENLSKLKRPKTIEIRNCQKFKGIDDISELESLETLHIQGCDCEDVNIQRSSGEMGSSPGSGALKIWIEAPWPGDLPSAVPWSWRPAVRSRSSATGQASSTIQQRLEQLVKLQRHYPTEEEKELKRWLSLKNTANQVIKVSRMNFQKISV